MVAVANKPPRPADKATGQATGAFEEALTSGLECLPALMLAWLCLRAIETWHAGAGVGVGIGVLFGPGIANDLLALLRHGAVFVIGSLLLAPVRSRRWRVVILGACWSLLLVLQAGLVQYHWVAGVPLGADLFGYSRSEVATTATGSWKASQPLALALLCALAVLWLLLNACMHAWWPRASARTALLVVIMSPLAFVFLPERYLPPAVHGEASADSLVNKMGYFVDRSLAHLASGGAAAEKSHAGGELPWAGKDPRYPFLHIDRTPDTLGPLFNTKPGKRPNIVFIIVEGLGRSFSGPGARFGSFTPFLDELAGRSLYFENFLSGQGRTFAVLTTVFGSLPFGDNGLTALGSNMPRHASLLSILKAQGYRLKFYTGSNLEFDNEGLFLRGEGVDLLISERDFGPPYERSNTWGYADRALAEVVLQREAVEATTHAGTPFVSIVKTTSMHTPFTFPDMPRYLKQVSTRLTQLGIAQNTNPAYTSQRDIFASVLYMDDALRLFFEGAARLPGYDNTVFIVTGDHRLPELPMDTRIERYHVPLIIYSPLLKAPQSIKALSSQFDITPSLLAWLGQQHGLRAPHEVTWLGTGLDTEKSFRNLHAIPLKQTKTELSDFVSGTVYLAQDRLYTLGDGMQTDRAADITALAMARAQFKSFLRANAMAGRAAELAPASKTAELVAYSQAGRTLRSTALAAEGAGVSVTGVRRHSDADTTLVEAVLTNGSTSPSLPFVPLLVLSDAAGQELGETAGDLQTLQPGQSRKIMLRANLGKRPHGTYFVSVIPSHPETGRSIGVGQYHVEIRL